MPSVCVWQAVIQVIMISPSGQRKLSRSLLGMLACALPHILFLWPIGMLCIAVCNVWQVFLMAKG